jgi:hypothetical protein
MDYTGIDGSGAVSVDSPGQFPRYRRPQYRNPNGSVTVVSGKLGSDVRAGTWQAILRQTGIEEPEK